MSVFGNYARYYDLLYMDKDYVGETKYIERLLLKHGDDIVSVLELGCGTGKHASMLCQKGYSVCGVDRSDEMLRQASERAAELQLTDRLEFSQCDIRDVDMGKQFDAVLSLFHVVSYLTTDDDLRTFFKVVRKHLGENGVFVFDVWYGPAVLAQRPEERELHLEDDHIDVTRFARPELHTDSKTVTVNYEIQIRDKESGGVETVQEKHEMRYLFADELKKFISEAGMDVISSEEWMTGNAPGDDTWGVCFVARA